MSRFITALPTALILSLVPPAWAGGILPEPSGSRVILHGVDCSIAYATVCDADRAVFDEAIDSMPRSATVVIQNRVLDLRAGGSAQPLARDSAEAVRDYFVSAGVAPEQVEIEECPATQGIVGADDPIEVQLSTVSE